MIAPTSFFADYGCHVRILEETRALQALGHRVVICTYHNGSDVPGVEVRRSIDVPWRKRVVVGSSRHKLYLDGVLSCEVLRTALRFKPDIIHAHLHEGALIGGTLARLIRRPLVFDYQGSLTEEMLDHGFLRRNGRIQAGLRRIERRINRLADVIVTSSHNARERLIQQGLANERLTTILDAVDTDRFSPAAVPDADRQALRHLFGLPPGARVIVYLGLLAPYQGSDLLLRSARMVLDRVPDAFFLVMGFPGHEDYRIMAEGLDLGGRVSFPGRIPYLDAHRYLALGEIAVAPKMSLTEGNGKLYNYMAMGLPVVAFDAPANREILGDLGVYAHHGDTRDFAGKLIDLLEQPKQAATLGLRLRERAVRRLAWKQRVGELLAVYETLLQPDRKVDDGKRATSITHPAIGPIIVSGQREPEPRQRAERELELPSRR
ncbi:glycosyltransferase family 4 protein [Nitrolancea hollandica]|uniref:Glycosyl transferase group 1 n=1 Tax=Nitrolancea hollandica Lb TaxID=1129897 RepID=I4EF68_9BACT|nr:glycosyltransferase family 4 protein [Nitrolancea hollandica]CCF83330.1 Glycosyl transferase group 1 [Nitrolancea hollandica Lb]